MSPRLTVDDLVARYHSYGRPRQRWLIGGEFERHLLDEHGLPAPYTRHDGVQHLLQDLSATGTWRPTYEGAAVIALDRPGIKGRPGPNVTLEPGAQFELSGAPHSTAREVLDEATAFAAEVAQHLDDTPYQQVAIGLTPFARIDDISWVPKGRYVIMREHMRAAGTLGHHMMKGTAATQASYDFSDMADASRKLRMSRDIAPLMTAMFANSPYARGRATGWRSTRGKVWTQTDAHRTGFPEALRDYSHEAWVDYLLDVPMMFKKPGEQWLAAHGQTFRQWMQSDEGPAPTWADWELHQTSVFPEVRIKAQIEVRGADAVPLPLAGAFVALYEGLFYCPRALQSALALGERFQRYGTQAERFERGCRDGLQATVGGRRLADWAEDLLYIARSGLEARARSDADLLLPLERLAEHGETPADRLLAELGPTPTVAALRAAARIEGELYKI